MSWHLSPPDQGKVNQLNMSDLEYGIASSKFYPVHMFTSFSQIHSNINDSKSQKISHETLIDIYNEIQKGERIVDNFQLCHETIRNWCANQIASNSNKFNDIPYSSSINFSNSNSKKY